MTRRTILDELPDEALVPVGWVRALLDEPAADGIGDLTVRQAGELLGRSPSSIRTWCQAGELEAYKLRGRQWRITRQALEQFQEREREAHSMEENGKRTKLGVGRNTELGAWRKVRA